MYVSLMEFNVYVFVAQLLNFLIIFFWFKYFVWDKIRDLIEYRKWLDEKYSNVEADIENILSDAESQKRTIIDDALAHKQQLIQQSESAATIKAEKIMDDAQLKATSIENKAKAEADKLQSDLKSSYISSVKKISQLVLKKVIGKESDIQDAYIQEAMKKFG